MILSDQEDVTCFPSFATLMLRSQYFFVAFFLLPFFSCFLQDVASSTYPRSPVITSGSSAAPSNTALYLALVRKSIVQLLNSICPFVLGSAIYTRDTTLADDPSLRNWRREIFNEPYKFVPRADNWGLSRYESFKNETYFTTTALTSETQFDCHCH